MDITSFVLAQRDSALSLGGYDKYHTQLSRRIATIRKKFGRASARPGKDSDKLSVTAEDIRSNHEFVHLLVILAERAWAHGMHERSTHAENVGKGMSGPSRRHIISRLRKASKHAEELAALISNQEVTGATDVDLLEARSYAFMLAGAAEFEKQSSAERPSDVKLQREQWQPCLRAYSVARVIYDTLLRVTKKELFKEVIASNIDPSIRYAAYQSHLSRSLGHSALALQKFPHDDSQLVEAVRKLDPSAFQDESNNQRGEQRTLENIPSTVRWRSRSANVVDASVGQALAAVSAAEEVLTAFLSSDGRDASRKEKAAAYDNVLIASQDAADATRRAIDDMEKEMVDEGDARMQDLRVTSLAVNYALVGWRVGRNRVLMGDDDGATLLTEMVKTRKKSKKSKSQITEKEEGRSRKLARLRERVVLYDAILQSIDSVKELRGAARDTAFVEELEAKRAYFRALRCTNIAYSHALLPNLRNALALFVQAQKYSDEALKGSSSLPDVEAEEGKPPTLAVTSTQAQNLQDRLSGLILRHHALLDLEELAKEAAEKAERDGQTAIPLIERLEEYPPGDVDLTNLVAYPPRLEPIPLKPIFLDIAWNYVRYPGQEVAEAPAETGAKGPKGTQTAEAEKKEPAKRGWFGFGR